MLRSRMRRSAAQLALPLAFLVLTFSSGATTLAVMVSLAESEGASWAVPVVVLCFSIPQILLAPLGAPLLDRLGPRTVVLLSTAVQATLLLSAAAFPRQEIIIAMVAMKAAASSLDSAAFLLLADRMPRLSGKETTARLFARLDTARLIGSLVGPLIGGAVTQYAGVSWVFVIDAGAIALCGVIVLVTPHVQQPTVPAPASWWQRVKEAPTLLARNPATRAALLGLAAAIVFTSFYSVAEVLYALDVLRLDPVGYAILGQCFIVGRLVGAQLGARLTSANALWWLVVATFLMGAGLFLPGVVHNSIVAGVGFVIAGLANAAQVAAIRLVIVGEVPEDARGRSLSTMGSINQTAGVVGTAVAAPALALVGPAGLLVLAGLGTILAATATSLARGYPRASSLSAMQPEAVD
ncbi:MFS transporter [Microbacterium sp. GXS0129]|uniref:MFS transporter n=1 Tax=Microbacterium sp. GXS0129 TaxID=3377836 RepID=UPI00383A93A6